MDRATYHTPPISHVGSNHVRSAPFHQTAVLIEAQMKYNIYSPLSLDPPISEVIFRHTETEPMQPRKGIYDFTRTAKFTPLTQ